MNDIDQILALHSAYCEFTNCAASRPAKAIGQSGFLFTRLKKGGDLNTKTKDTLLNWFSTNWPEGLDWPEDVARPSSQYFSNPTDQDSRA